MYEEILELAITCLCLVPLLLDEDHLQLCERLVPRLWQGDQGEEGADEEEGGVQQEDPLHPHQLGQDRKCLQRVALEYGIWNMWIYGSYQFSLYIWL